MSNDSRAQERPREMSALGRMQPVRRRVSGQV